jgi:hypothetical protein
MADTNNSSRSLGTAGSQERSPDFREAVEEYHPAKSILLLTLKDLHVDASSHAADATASH